MILIDTSAWIEYYRKDGRKEYKKIILNGIEQNIISVNGIIQTELLIFCKNKIEYNLILNDLSSFHWFETDQKAYLKACEIGFSLKKIGITIPISDLIIGACALINNCKLIHFDKHYLQIKQHYPLDQYSLLK
jgi:predicted nucleic acid-binding protein